MTFPGIPGALLSLKRGLLIRSVQQGIWGTGRRRTLLQPSSRDSPPREAQHQGAFGQVQRPRDGEEQLFTGEGRRSAGALPLQHGQLTALHCGRTPPAPRSGSTKPGHWLDLKDSAASGPQKRLPLCHLKPALHSVSRHGAFSPCPTRNPHSSPPPTCTLALQGLRRSCCPAFPHELPRPSQRLLPPSVIQKDPPPHAGRQSVHTQHRAGPATPSCPMLYPAHTMPHCLPHTPTPTDPRLLLTMPGRAPAPDPPAWCAPGPKGLPSQSSRSPCACPACPEVLAPPRATPPALPDRELDCDPLSPEHCPGSP